MTRTHWGQHDGCYGCKLVTISIAPRTHPADSKDAAWSKDMEAYARLRRNGVQPRGIDGSAHVEQRAETSVEIESGYVMNDKQRRQFASLTADVPS